MTDSSEKSLYGIATTAPSGTGRHGHAHTIPDFDGIDWADLEDTLAAVAPLFPPGGAVNASTCLGSSFGGTNLGDTAAIDVATTYDYSAPIRECGGLGEEYRRVAGMGQFIREHGEQPARATPVDLDAQTGSKDVSVAAITGRTGMMHSVRANDSPELRQ